MGAVIRVLGTVDDLCRYGSYWFRCIRRGWCGLATQFFSDEQMERLRSYPDIGREELARFFTLTRKDLGFIDNLGRGGGRGRPRNLGWPCSCVRCRGWGSSLMIFGRCRRLRCCGWRTSWRCSPECWSSMGCVRRPVVII